MGKGTILGTEWASNDVQGRACQLESRRVRASQTSSGQAECDPWAIVRSGFPSDTAPPNHSTYGPSLTVACPGCTYSRCQRHTSSQLPEAGSVSLSELQFCPALSVLRASGLSSPLSEPPAHQGHGAAFPRAAGQLGQSRDGACKDRELRSHNGAEELGPFGA